MRFLISLAALLMASTATAQVPGASIVHRDQLTGTVYLSPDGEQVGFSRNSEGKHALFQDATVTDVPLIATHRGVTDAGEVFGGSNANGAIGANSLTNDDGTDLHNMDLANAVSDDGLVAVGNGQTIPVPQIGLFGIWDLSVDPETLEVVESVDGEIGASLFSITGDGSKGVGWSSTTAASDRQAVVMNMSTRVVTNLPFNGDGTDTAAALSVSNDGDLIVGYEGLDPILWDDEVPNVMDILPTHNRARALVITDDGELIGGQSGTSSSPGANTRGVLWCTEGEAKDLTDYMVDVLDFTLPEPGCKIASVTGLVHHADGIRISGLAYDCTPGNPNRNGFELQLPAGVDPFDVDGDGVNDCNDNCTEVANATQTDTDGDGYGNACDTDFDQTGFTEQADVDAFYDADTSWSLGCFFPTGPPIFRLYGMTEANSEFDEHCAEFNVLEFDSKWAPIGDREITFFGDRAKVVDDKENGTPPGPSCCGIPLP